jgi:phage/plasmid primase-like uncharacterized protein
VIARVRAAAAWIYDFVVGDDWRLAIAAIAAIALTAVAKAAGVTAWPVAPIIVLAVILWSVKPRRS